MKATLKMEATKQPTEGGILTQVKSSKVSSKRILLFGVLGLTALLIIVGIVLTSLYFGTHLLHEEIREYGADIRTDEGVHHETIKVTDKEVIIESDSIVIIRDYKAYVVLYKLTEDDVCYVSALNNTFENDSLLNKSCTATTPTGTKMPTDAFGTFETEYEVTDMELNPDVLSDQGRELCRGKKILWAHEISMDEHNSHSRIKRARRRRRRRRGKSCCCHCCCNCCCHRSFI